MNEFFELDIDQHDRIVGVELFGPSALHLSQSAGTEKIYKKNHDVYSFRISEQETKSRFRCKGIDFCFADEECTQFIGIRYCGHKQV